MFGRTGLCCSLATNQISILTTTIPLLTTMAYNRDWDKGKDHWSDQGYWPADNRGNVRGREDDYSGDWKRRKYNNGVCVPPFVLFSLVHIRHRDTMHSLTTKPLLNPVTGSPIRADITTLHPTTAMTTDMARASIVRSAWSRANQVRMSFFWV